MELTEILSRFNSAKESIRHRTLTQPNGLAMAVDYAGAMEYAVTSLFNLTSQTHDPHGLAAFLYGSPGRREMVCESDLDMLIVDNPTAQNASGFRNTFKNLAKPFKFVKVDLPEWGSLEDCATFAQKSITEGNQVIEARYVCGDSSVQNKLATIQRTFGSPERMTRNIVFQKFYFDQYFKQRVRDGDINIKYCDGGSRDYLFMHWFNTLMGRKDPTWNKTDGVKPVAEVGLTNLYHNGLLSPTEFEHSLQALNFNLLLRNEVLLANKGTPDEGLTFFDDRTARNVFTRLPQVMQDYSITSPRALQERFDEQRGHIASIKGRIWDLMLQEEGKVRGNDWATDFKTAYNPKTLEIDREVLLGRDSLTTIGLIWGASNAGHTHILEKIMEQERDSDSWEIQGSLVTSPHCPTEYLHHIGTGLAKETGYGYILRVIGRHQNVASETLHSIAEDTHVEPRYSQVAIAALRGGAVEANNQV